MTGPSRSYSRPEDQEEGPGGGAPRLRHQPERPGRAVLRRWAHYDRAEPLLLQALKIRKKVLGEEHPDYATSLNNLAKLYHAMGAYGRAEPLCRQAWRSGRRSWGRSTPTTPPA